MQIMKQLDSTVRGTEHFHFYHFATSLKACIRGTLSSEGKKTGALDMRQRDK